MSTSDPDLSKVIAQTPQLIGTVRREDHTPEVYRKLCELAVKSGLSLTDLVNCGNYELYLEYAVRHPHRVSCIPGSFLTPQVCITIIDRNHDAIIDILYAIEYCHIILSDSDRYIILKKCVLLNPVATLEVKPQRLTREMKQLAVSINGLALRYIPVREHDDNLIIASVKQNALAIHFVEKQKRTRELVGIAYSGNRLSFALIHDPTTQHWLVKYVLARAVMATLSINLSTNLLTEVALALVHDPETFPMISTIPDDNSRYSLFPPCTNTVIGLAWSLPYHVVWKIARLCRHYGD